MNTQVQIKVGLKQRRARAPGRNMGLCLALPLILLAACAFGPFAPALALGRQQYALFQLTYNTWDEGRPVAVLKESLGATGGWVVWSSPTVAGSDSEIHLYDLVTRTSTLLTDDSAEDHGPAVTSRGDVVWIKGMGPEAEVYAYLASASYTLRVTNNRVEDSDVSAAGDLVAYLRNEPGAGKPHQTVLFNLATRTGLVLTSDSLSDARPHTDGEWVTWAGWDGHDFEIYR